MRVSADGIRRERTGPRMKDADGIRGERNGTWRKDGTRRKDGDESVRNEQSARGIGALADCCMSRIG